jgi:hypothetical protein
MELRVISGKVDNSKPPCVAFRSLQDRASPSLHSETNLGEGDFDKEAMKKWQANDKVYPL